KSAKKGLGVTSPQLKQGDQEVLAVLRFQGPKELFVNPFHYGKRPPQAFASFDAQMERNSPRVARMGLSNQPPLLFEGFCVVRDHHLVHAQLTRDVLLRHDFSGGSQIADGSENRILGLGQTVFLKANAQSSTPGVVGLPEQIARAYLRRFVGRSLER